MITEASLSRELVLQPYYYAYRYWGLTDSAYLLVMSDKEQLLSRPASGTYYSSPSPDQTPSFLKRVVRIEENAERAVKRAWVKFVQFIHAREFFAEFLGTFILVVRF